MVPVGKQTLGPRVRFSIRRLNLQLPEPIPQDEIWQARFAAECVADVTTRTLTAEAPSYATIMELDRKVREFPLPEGLSSPSDDQATSFKSFILEHIRETRM